jgi:hypothetical protein
MQWLPVSAMTRHLPAHSTCITPSLRAQSIGHQALSIGHQGRVNQCSSGFMESSSGAEKARWGAWGVPGVARSVLLDPGEG